METHICDWYTKQAFHMKLHFVFVTTCLCGTVATLILSMFKGNTENLNRRGGGLSEHCTKLKYVSQSADILLLKNWCSNLALKIEWCAVQFYVLCRQSIISCNVNVIFRKSEYKWLVGSNITYNYAIQRFFHNLSCLLYTIVQSSDALFLVT